MIIEIQNLTFNNPKGFIVLEGANGAGKSTVARILKQQAEIAKKKVLQTFEPGNTKVGQAIRQIVLGQNSQDTKLTALSELLLFSADRNLHVNQLILPALNDNQVVICDRYFYSTLAFQGYGRGLDLKMTQEICELGCEALKPDVVILLDLPAEIGLQRTKKRTEQDNDSFESEELAFHNRLREGFLSIAKQSNEQFVIIDSTQSEQQVCERALLVLNKLLEAL